MGTLVVMCYPTVLAGGAADHTYVKCGTDRMAWDCWGGKTGGRELRRGEGSTQRADRIAEPNERGGITCYLVNGVCHQAANRILFPAGIFVRGARGYGLSVVIYGPYGRERGVLGTCLALFHQHPGVTGDLPACIDASLRAASVPNFPPEEIERERRYFANVNETYSQAASLRGLQSSPDQVEFMLTLFTHKLELSLDPVKVKPVAGKLRDLRAGAERSRIELEDAFGEKRLAPRQFVEESERQVKKLQNEFAATLDADDYQALLDLKPGELAGLADPDIVKQAYGN